MACVLPELGRRQIIAREMVDSLADKCRRLARALGLGGAENIVSVTPLTGGVASDIAMVDVGGTRLCMKFALAKLRVAADWRAPVHRNLAEYRWLEFAGRAAPGAAPRLFGHDETENGFAMAYVAGDDVVLWKAALLAGRPDDGEAAAVGDVLGRLHSASAMPDFDRTGFENRDDFRAIRLEPYLLFTATRHPAVAAPLTALADGLYAAEIALVHGDVSPKNILFKDGAPILLDAECACMGDPAFDVAFCLNHLVLKAVHLPDDGSGLLEAAANLWRAYAAHVDWEPVDGLETRVAALLPALMLARVDGKSPVEYLSEADGDHVRRLALALIVAPPTRLADLFRVVEEG